ncbi:DUF4190 domain-containing protein [Aeromicrobium sp. NPDC092404]|uniref:DUF4190 domain-containing protein n=1 Tax=Aeromicrobium sp. NPDC092404 TaxID=3154976 RepID=UPI003447E267
MTNQPPPYPGDSPEPSTSGLPSYGSTPPPSEGSYPPPPGGYPSAPGGYGTPPKQNQLALWSMITGIVAIVLGLIGACGVIFGPVAIGLGIPGRRQVAASQGTQKGGGMATAGLVLGIIATVLSVIWIILFATGVLELPGT